MDVPPTAYAEAVDGADIAYKVGGSGPYLVYASGVSNVETRWDYAPHAAMLRRLMSFSRLVLFDQRGMGASAPIRSAPMASWEEWADDFRRVLAATGIERTALYAEFDVTRWAILFAALHPDRVTHLILWNGHPRGVTGDDYPYGLAPEAMDDAIAFLRRSWGTLEGVRLTNSDLFAREDAADFLEAAARYQRTCIAPSTFAEWCYAGGAVDVRHALPLIQAPTLILHRRDHPMTPIGHARYMAERIPDARLVELPGGDGELWAGGDDALALMEEFLTGRRAVPVADRVLSTVVFTDIVRSTELAVALGDTAWRRLLDLHDTVTRERFLAEHGRVVKSTGDGLLATFDSPTRALRAALATRDDVRGHGIDIRVGIHTGEVERRDDDIAGVAVHIAARVQATAAPGEVLVSRTVKDLVSGSDLMLEARGTHELKGVPEPWELYAVTK